MNQWQVYIVQCADNTLYTGVTINTERRLRQHNGELAGGAKYTAVRRPVSVVYSSTHSDRSAACTEESRIKKLSRTEKISLINNASNH